MTYMVVFQAMQKHFNGMAKCVYNILAGLLQCFLFKRLSFVLKTFADII